MDGAKAPYAYGSEGSSKVMTYSFINLVI